MNPMWTSKQRGKDNKKKTIKIEIKTKRHTQKNMSRLPLDIFDKIAGHLDVATAISFAQAIKTHELQHKLNVIANYKRLLLAEQRCIIRMTQRNPTDDMLDLYDAFETEYKEISKLLDQVESNSVEELVNSITLSS